RATQAVRPSSSRRRTFPIVDGCGVLEAHSTSSEFCSRYTRQESHSMNSTIRETIHCSTSCRLISRTIRRLIFWKSRSCCSVRSSLDSISLTLGTCPIIDRRGLFPTASFFLQMVPVVGFRSLFPDGAAVPLLH